jgi:hypothetical protein
MDAHKPFVDLPEGSPEWTAYQALRSFTLEIERWQLANNTFTPDDSDTLYHEMLNFLRNRINHTSVWNRNDVESLIHRSIGMLTLILHVCTETDYTDTNNFRRHVNLWINQVYTILCQIPEDSIDQILSTNIAQEA